MMYNVSMRIGIYYYPTAAQNEVAVQVLKKSLEKQHSVFVLFSVESIPDLDVLIVLGGDGSLLSVATTCGQKGIRLIGVNYGHLGFLTELDSSDLLKVVSFLEKGNFQEEHRSVLQLEFDGRNFFALNEIVFQRQYTEGSHRHIIGIKALIEGKLVDTYAADGLIVCTPTGSTAYSLSAGGAVMSPDISAFMLTPICAHSLRSRPVVYNDSKKLSVELTDDFFIADIYCDGKKICEFSTKNKIVVSRAAFDVVFLTDSKHNFYDKLFYKLNKWSVG